MSQVSIISTKKFKDVVVTLRFAKNDQSKNTERALLALMLSDRSSTYNTKVKMNRKLDNMFGATLHSSVRDYGKAHIIDLSLGVLNEKFVKANLLLDQLELLSELIYKPLLSEEVFSEAKQVLTDMLNRDSDNLSSYTTKQALKVAGAGYPLEFNRIGSLEVLENLTLADIKAEMESMLASDVLNIIVVGDVDKEETLKLIDNYFTFKSKNLSFESSYLLRSSKVKNEIEYKDTQQAYLTIVYDTNTLNVGKDYWSLQMMSMILGQLPNSFLFQEVREKRSLCYSIRSNVRGYDGVMTISAGVRSNSVDEAIDLSIKQVDRIVNGEFNDGLFDSAKVMLIDSIYKTDDSNRRMIDSEYRKIILDEDYSTDDLVEIIKDISRDDIVEVAKRLNLNTIYKVVRKDKDEENSQ